MVLADPELVGLGLGLGVEGGEVTDALDSGGDDDLAGGLQVRVSGGDGVFPWSRDTRPTELFVSSLAPV